MEYERDKCPCCGSGNYGFLYNLSYGSVNKCVDCLTAYTVFKDPDILSLNETFGGKDFLKARIYDQYEFRRIARNRLCFLSKFVNSGEILEFGSSTGEFLYEAAGKGYKVSSVDLHPVVLSINKTNNLQDIVESNAIHFKAKKTYEAIVAFHLIEHLADPAGFLSNCRMSLKPGGVIFIEVPNFSSFTRKILGKRSGMFYDYHICHFDKDSLGRLMKKCGYEVIAVRTIDDPVRYIAPIYNPLRHGLWYLLRKFRKQNKGNICEDKSGNSNTRTTAKDEVDILNSRKAKIYRLESGFIRVISMAFLPVCMLLDKYYLGSGLQVIAKRTKSEE